MLVPSLVESSRPPRGCAPQFEKHCHRPILMPVHYGNITADHSHPMMVIVFPPGVDAYQNIINHVMRPELQGRDSRNILVNLESCVLDSKFTSYESDQICCSA
ncbi:hypothetical protein TNCV_1730731 [Trichonephila clavipes]|nr:hypothetical protein TNCV_1730731 [Trichonephila clavipes]